MSNADDIRDFLTTRRAKITPERAGLPAYGRLRRVSGLRREEVALLAGISVEYNTRLERGDARGESDEVLDPDDVTEHPLAGGMGSGGEVVRVGDTVRRPMQSQSATVHVFLHHLEQVGFEGAPRHIGTDDQGRAILTYIPGDVGIPPYPAWTADEDLLLSIAELQRDLHRAAAGFIPPVDAVWDVANLPPIGPGAIVCHNDLCVENVVVRDGRAVAFIDFDFAAPSDRLVDIAIAARHWVPVRAPEDLDAGRAGLDQVDRFQRFLDAHGLTREQRPRVVDELGGFLDRALVSMKRRADAGQPAYVQAWTSGYPRQNRRSRAWLDAHASALSG